MGWRGCFRDKGRPQQPQLFFWQMGLLKGDIPCLSLTNFNNSRHHSWQQRPTQFWNCKFFWKGPKTSQNTLASSMKRLRFSTSLLVSFPLDLLLRWKKSRDAMAAAEAEKAKVIPREKGMKVWYQKIGIEFGRGEIHGNSTFLTSR